MGMIMPYACLCEGRGRKGRERGWVKGGDGRKGGKERRKEKGKKGRRRKLGGRRKGRSHCKG